MTIKEVEQELHIPRATIRFYEKNNLISPSRGDNSYRDYTNEDIAILRKVIIFRKLGMTISDIQDILGDVSPLPQMVDKNIDQLENQIKELTGALKVCKQLQANHDELKGFDDMYYWNLIQSEEKNGNRFLDIAKDVAKDIAKYEKKVALDIFSTTDCYGNPMYGKTETVLRAIGLCLIIGIFNCFLYKWQIHAFWEGFFMPFSWFVITTILGLPLHFLEKKYPNQANLIRKIGITLGVIFTLLLITFAIFAH